VSLDVKKMEREEFKEKWKEADEPPLHRRLVYIGNNGCYIITDDYLSLTNGVYLFIYDDKERNIEIGWFPFKDISDLMEY